MNAIREFAFGLFLYFAVGAATIVALAALLAIALVMEFRSRR